MFSSQQMKRWGSDLRSPYWLDPFGVGSRLGEQTAFHIDAAVHLHEPALDRASAAFFGVPQKRRVGPATDKQIVICFVVQDPFQPAKRQAQVGADAQGQPQIRFLSKRRQRGVDQDVLVGTLENSPRRCGSGVS